jgi:hypothetical protein
LTTILALYSTASSSVSDEVTYLHIEYYKMSADMHEIESLLQQSRDRTKVKGRHRVSVGVTFQISKKKEDYLQEQFMSAENGEPTMAKIIQEMWYHYRPIVVMREETEEFFFEIWDAASGRILEIPR